MCSLTLLAALALADSDPVPERGGAGRLTGPGPTS